MSKTAENRPKRVWTEQAWGIFENVVKEFGPDVIIKIRPGDGSVTIDSIYGSMTSNSIYEYKCLYDADSLPEFVWKYWNKEKVT